MKIAAPAQNRDPGMMPFVGRVGVIARDGRADLAHTVSELLFGEQDLRNVVVHVPNLYRRISLPLSPLINLRDQSGESVTLTLNSASVPLPFREKETIR